MALRLGILVHLQPPLYVGCYTNRSSVGIHVFDAAEDGRLTKVGDVSGIEHPSYLAPHPGGSILYAASETSDGNGTGGTIVAFAVDPSDGTLAMIQQVPSGGDGPCYLSVDATGNHIYVAHYGSGSVAGFELDAKGRIGELAVHRQHVGHGPTERQQGPHAHCAIPHPNQTGFVAVDLGIDRVISYANDGRVLSEFAASEGSGPRHLAWHPDQPVGFLVGELDNALTALSVDPVTGALTTIVTESTLPTGFAGTSIAAEVRIHPNQKWIYVSNRGHDSLAVFEFRDRTLEPVGHVHSGGSSPRSFSCHPAGKMLFVANQESDSLLPFGIDPHSGIPEQLDDAYQISEPVCVTFMEVAS